MPDRNWKAFESPNKEFDEKEIFPYRIEGLGKNLIPSVTDFDIIDKYIKVNDENSDIKNNRLELLQRLCSTFNTFIDFSKLEGN